MGLFDGIVGGVSGLLSGGPIAGGAGLLGGLLGNNDGRTESGVNYRALTPAELRIQQAAQRAMPGMISQLGEAFDPAALASLQAALYGPAAQAINDSARTTGSQIQATALRRGTGPSSRMQEQQTRLAGQQQQALGQASQQATTGAYGLLGQQQAQALAGVQGLGSLLGGLDQMRLQGGTAYSRTPGAGISEGLAGIGSALTNNESWWRNRSGGV